LPIANLLIADWLGLIVDNYTAWNRDQIANRKSAIGNPQTHPLPRGGTDFITSQSLDRNRLVFTEQHNTGAVP